MFFAWGWKWSAFILLCIVSNLIWLYNDHVIKWERCIVVAGSRWSDFSFVLPNKNMHLLHICAIKSANTFFWVRSKKALSVLLLFCFVCVFCNIIRQNYSMCNFHYPAVWLFIISHCVTASAGSISIFSWAAELGSRLRHFSPLA